VGFRPFVWRLAARHGLGGWVLNRAGGVEIEVEGEAAALAAFQRDLLAQAPPLARIEGIRVEPAPPRGESAFAILPSRAAGPAEAVPPDVATCADCLDEVFDPADRRHRYPFTNCTNCGPRFTVIRGLPYDRERTSMAGFPLCADCDREYRDPADRRFHAEPVACPACGPRLTLLDCRGRPVAGDPLPEAAARLRAGAIVAVKGLGGYHLAVDARSEPAVQRLRARKRRPARPLAVMVADLQQARSLCHLSPQEEELLAGPRRPVVLLARRPEADLAPSVAPGVDTLGLLLPYTPLHHLLLADFGGPLVMTSGNLSDEPLACGDQEALDRLGGIADFFLAHDRPIEVRCDDSVVRLAGGRPVLLRRSRGWVPQPVPLPLEAPRPILACGAQLKNTFCLMEGPRAYPGPHVGDLESYPTLRWLEAAVAHMQRLLGITPEAVAHDAHPDLLSTRFALETGLPALAVQHHHAHVASVLAENGTRGPVLGVAFDGTGYGSDGQVWGGEFLLADLAGFERLVHLEYVPLPGGEQAVRQPWRMALAWLHRALGRRAAELPFWKGRPVGPVLSLIERGAGPLTSSLGRLFDAVACLALGRQVADYEGQAAMELEAAADRGCREAYEFALGDGVVQVTPVIQAVLEDVQGGLDPGRISARFHNGLARLVGQVCRALGHRSVALSGGVFQNALLLERTLEVLDQDGFEVLLNRQVPPNDGGICLGQAAVAAARLAEGG
jgi:hydrogenase maturation protein HypF